MVLNFPELFGSRRIVFVDVVHARDLADLGTSKLPSSLHNPRQGTIKASGLILDFLEHNFREVEALFPLVAAGSGRGCLVCHFTTSS